MQVSTACTPSRPVSLMIRLFNFMQDVTERVHNGYFVDLFVRKSNAVAISMYEKVNREQGGGNWGGKAAYSPSPALSGQVPQTCAQLWPMNLGHQPSYSVGSQWLKKIRFFWKRCTTNVDTPC